MLRIEDSTVEKRKPLVRKGDIQYRRSLDIESPEEKQRSKESGVPAKRVEWPTGRGRIEQFKTGLLFVAVTAGALSLRSNGEKLLPGR